MSLFALIFSIGILVDDAIVVVENIHRHMAAWAGKTLLECIPPAVDEVGGPTILATFTVIAALLPMAFVSGLMGPYMRPIPINAAAGMLMSLAVALVRHAVAEPEAAAPRAGRAPTAAVRAPSRLAARLFRRLRRAFPAMRVAASARVTCSTARIVAAGAAGDVAWSALQWVVLKMLPFDNKSEFQVVVDMPEGTLGRAHQRACWTSWPPMCARCRR